MKMPVDLENPSDPATNFRPSETMWTSTTQSGPPSQRWKYLTCHRNMSLVSILCISLTIFCPRISQDNFLLSPFPIESIDSKKTSFLLTLFSQRGVTVPQDAHNNPATGVDPLHTPKTFAAAGALRPPAKLTQARPSTCSPSRQGLDLQLCLGDTSDRWVTWQKCTTTAFTFHFSSVSRARYPARLNCKSITRITTPVSLTNSPLSPCLRTSMSKPRDLRTLGASWLLLAFLAFLASPSLASCPPSPFCSLSQLFFFGFLSPLPSQVSQAGNLGAISCPSAPPWKPQEIPLCRDKKNQDNVQGLGIVCRGGDRSHLPQPSIAWVFKAYCLSELGFSMSVHHGNAL
ncbi:hypothetical protein B0T14DRAFT_87753 [Immersiella caudata]|uniref:Uncharacterized protein n=1 Tax=Immersiella caudata TaxID=314043 RepID=A0AA39TZS3_9PEZI|nr:hypothetical protein B0T14DRAFT_87753 [Immersiella caudata]